MFGRTTFADERRRVPRRPTSSSTAGTSPAPPVRTRRFPPTRCDACTRCSSPMDEKMRGPGAFGPEGGAAARRRRADRAALLPRSSRLTGHPTVSGSDRQRRARNRHDGAHERPGRHHHRHLLRAVVLGPAAARRTSCRTARPPRRRPPASGRACAAGPTASAPDVGHRARAGVPGRAPHHRGRARRTPRGRPGGGARRVGPPPAPAVRRARRHHARPAGAEPPHPLRPPAPRGHRPVGHRHRVGQRLRQPAAAQPREPAGVPRATDRAASPPPARRSAPGRRRSHRCGCPYRGAARLGRRCSTTSPPGPSPASSTSTAAPTAARSRSTASRASSSSARGEDGPPPPPRPPRRRPRPHPRRAAGPADLRPRPRPGARPTRGSPSIRCSRPVVAAGPGVRVPGTWDPHETGVRAIVGQQVSVRGAEHGHRAHRRAGWAPRCRASRTSASPTRSPTRRRSSQADLAGIGMPGARADGHQGVRGRGRQGRRPDRRPPPARRPGRRHHRGARPRPVDGELPRAAHGRARRLPRGRPRPPARRRRRRRRRSPPPALAERAERWRPHRAAAAVRLWMSERLGSPSVASSSPARPCFQ